MRQVVLDTETTGLEVERGHRIIEIGCVELVNRRPTGRTFHHYLNPGREIDAGAREVHGITNEMLADKPRFADIGDALLEFLEGAELVIHNAAFDVAFIEQELALLGRATGTPRKRLRDVCRVLDTLALARDLHPGQRCSLDALCKRYSIDNSHREYHGALLDARILADVYIAMTSGQNLLALDAAAGSALQDAAHLAPVERPSTPLVVVEANEEELAAHEALLAAISKASGGKLIWQARQQTAA
jgi:DNA polymerase-3 subunit epsilon